MTESRYELKMERGPQPGQVYPLTDPSHTVGRDPISDICISDPEVSRQHGLLIQMPGGGYKIQDLGSTNGTVVDGIRLAGEAFTLKPGQLIALGGSVALRYQLAGPTQEEEASGAFVQPVVPVQEAAHPAAVTHIDVVRPEAVPAVELQNAPAEPPEIEWKQREPVRASQVSGARGQSGASPLQQDFSTFDSTPETSDSGRRLLSIALGVLLVLVCLCCALTTFMYYYGGDWLLRQMGVVP
jgi:pSer/pThr/pTyr-binding forkhead associated (FHA) protein